MPTKSREQLTQDALEIFHAGIRAVDPGEAVRRFIRLGSGRLLFGGPDGPPLDLDLADLERIVVVGAGKASACMAQATEEILGDLVAAGLVSVKRGYGAPTCRIRVQEAGHPVPDRAGLAAAQEIISLVSPLGPRDLVLCLLSGGGSALLPLPAPGISLAEKQELTDLLLAAGADIVQINTVRKHLSSIKGGGLARAAAPAQVISLILSDVVGDRIEVIASGPTVADPSTFGQAREVLVRHGLWERVSESIRVRLEAGLAKELIETPKPGDPALQGCAHFVVGSNHLALLACEEAAARLGYRPLVLSGSIEGESREIARMHAAIAREVRQRARPIPPPACIISGGETTVTLRGRGRGGRNQELALAAALNLCGEKGLVLLSAGTDGTDGPTDAAGAMAFGDTVARGLGAGLIAAEHLHTNDAYPFFDRLGDLIRTGPTGTNVMDIHLILVSG